MATNRMNNRGKVNLLSSNGKIRRWRIVLYIRDIMEKKIQKAIDEFESFANAMEHDLQTMSACPPDWWDRILKHIKYEKMCTYRHCVKILEEILDSNQ